MNTMESIETGPVHSTADVADDKPLPKEEVDSQPSGEGEMTDVQQQEEEGERQHHDICRVCRAEGTPESPLFYPCLCSGSIKFVHQECLVEWLKHSKKKQCELCKHPFSFNPVYKSGMPPKLPYLLLVKGIAGKIGSFFFRIGRLITLLGIWLGLVPWASGFVVRKRAESLGLASPSDIESMVLGSVLDGFMGLGLCFLSLIFLVGLTMLVNFMGSHHLLDLDRIHRKLRKRFRKPKKELREDDSEVPLTIENDDGLSVASASTVGRGNARWTKDVSPREYRAYLKRRELYRERIDRQQQRITQPDDQVEEDNQSVVNEQSVDYESITGNNSSLRRRSTRDGSSPALGTNGHSASVGLRRDAVRCKICNSSTCISREHVVQASLQSRDAEAAPRPQPQVDPQPLPQPAYDQDHIHWHVDILEALGLKANKRYVPIFALSFVTLNFLLFSLFIGFPFEQSKNFFKLLNALKTLSSLVLISLPDKARTDLLLLVGISTDCWNYGWAAVFRLKEMLPVWLIELASNQLKVLSFLKIGDDCLTALFGRIVLGNLVNMVLFSTARRFFIDRQEKLEGQFRRRGLQILVIYQAMLKLTLMLLVELWFFPLLTGWMIDVATLPLMSSSFQDRLVYFSSHSIISSLLHWAVGLMFMLYLSNYVTHLRRVFRSGLLYFIRNPNDSESLPMKDTVERPLLEQLVRAVRSLTLYGFLVGLFFGCFSLLSKKLVPNFAPLHFRLNDFLIDTPLDVLVQLGNSLAVKVIQPVSMLKVIDSFLASVAKQLHLSSYVFGGRYLREESFPHNGRWVFVPSADKSYKPSRVLEMFHRPVEPADIAKIPIVDGKEAVQLPSREQLIDATPPEPRRFRGRRIVLKEKDDPLKSFTVVYRPNWIVLRSLVFFGALLVAWQCAAVVMVIAPVLLGRAVLQVIFAGYRAHDLYAHGVGFFFLVLLVKAAMLTSQSLFGAAAADAKTIFFTWPKTAIKMLLVGFVAFVVWPLLVGAYFIAFLVPFVSSPNETVIMLPFHAWSLGVPIMHSIYQARNFMLNDVRVRLLELLATNLGAWKQMDLALVMNLLILPYTARLLGLLLLPPLAVMCIAPMVDLEMAQVLMLQRWSYSLSLLVPVALVGWSFLRRARRQLVDNIRDEQFLIGRELRNFDRPQLA